MEGGDDGQEGQEGDQQGGGEGDGRRGEAEAAQRLGDGGGGETKGGVKREIDEALRREVVVGVRGGGRIGFFVFLIKYKKKQNLVIFDNSLSLSLSLSRALSLSIYIYTYIYICIYIYIGTKIVFRGAGDAGSPRHQANTA
jgi:hypothetical protein